MRTIRFILAAALTLAACSQAGCSKAPASVGEEKSSLLQGTRTLVSADPVAVTAAAKAVAEDLKLNVEQSAASGLDGKLVARSANKMKLVVNVKLAGENVSAVSIRAGGFGDRTIQKQVLDRIKAKLPAQPAVAQKPTTQPAQAQADAAQLPF